MRLERLHLIRYGSFSEREIVLRPEARLHIVFGPNEAGKSSALAAVSDLLFGFPHKTDYDFLHNAANLRVGATLRRRDGGVLSFRRRKGRQSTILADDESGTALSDDCLLPYLGSLSREVFERAFGLNSERLRDGGREMLRSDGELGSILFAAASGLTGLSALKSAMDNEADEIFAIRASDRRRFYQVLGAHRTALEEERANQLKASDWKALVKEIGELEERDEALKDTRADTQRRLQGLRRLRRLQPVVAEIDREEVALAAYDDLAHVPTGFAEKLAERLAALSRAGTRRAAGRDLVETQARAVAAIDVDEDLFVRTEAVSALFAGSGNYEKTLHDLPRVVAERDTYAADIADLAGRLGVADPGRSRPPDALLARMGEVIGEGRVLAESERHSSRLLGEDRAALARLDAEQPAILLIDPKPWRERMAALAPVLKRIEAKYDLETRHLGEKRAMVEAAARLVPPADVEILALAPLPSLDELAQRRDVLAALDDEKRSLRERLQSVSAETARLELAIAETERGGPVPTQAAILEARAVREASFARLTEALRNTGPAPDRPAVAAMIEEFEELSRTADALADRALADAERVSAHAAALGQRATRREEGARLEARALELDALREQALAGYRVLFEPLAIEPSRPERMIGWVAAATDILDRRRRLLEIEDQIATADALAGEIRPSLEALAEGVGLADYASLPGTALARAIEERLGGLADGWAASRSLAGRREDCARRIASLGRELDEVGARRTGWRAAFEAAAVALGLSQDARLGEAEATVRLWEKLPDLQREHENRERRVAGLRRDAAAYEGEVIGLVEALAPDLKDLPAIHAVKLLNEKAQKARTEMARRRDGRAALTEAEAALAQAQRERHEAEAARDELLGGWSGDGDPETLLTRLRERDRLLEELRKCRARFAEFADGEDEAAVRGELAGFDRERAEIDIAALEPHASDLDEEGRELFARLSERRRERDRLDAAKGAERAAFARSVAEAELVGSAREWAVLKIASNLLSSAMEKHRQSGKDPLMRRAGELFRILTAGSFASLTQEYGEDDAPQLLGVRATGEQVSFAGLSDGTRDQLYLALRLAFLEDYSGRNEPVPFIGDDIFQTFDDERTAAGLLSLAEAGGSMQPILFAHHRHVADIARDVMGEAVDVISL